MIMSSLNCISLVFGGHGARVWRSQLRRSLGRLVAFWRHPELATSKWC